MTTTTTRPALPKVRATRAVTLDDLTRHDAEVRIALRRRHVAWLRVIGAHIPDARVAMPYPGAPAGAVYLPVDTRICRADVHEALGLVSPYAKGGEFGEPA